MSGGITALARLLDWPATPIPVSQLAVLAGNHVADFERRGWLIEGPAAMHVRCTLCDDAHDAPVQFDPDRRRWFQVCIESGHQADLDASARDTRLVDVNAICASIRAAVAPVSFAIRELEAGRLWLLGESAAGGRAFTVMLGVRLTGEGLLRTLARLPSVSTTPGLVLSSTAISRDLPEVGGHRIVPLADVIAYTPGAGLCADVGALRAALGVPSDKRAKGGRPSAHEDEALSVIDQLSLEELQRLGSGDLIAFMQDRVPGLRTTNRGQFPPTLIPLLLDRIEERRRALANEGRG